MNLKIFKDALFTIERFAYRHQPEILAGVGIGGFITSTVLAVKATPEAVQKLEEKKKELQVEELTVVDTVKTAGMLYLPAVATSVASTCCVIGSVSTSLKRTAALATAYQMSREYISTYRDKVIESVGEKKEEKIRHSVNQEMIDKNPPSDYLYNNRPNHSQLFLDKTTGTYFWSNLKTVEEKLVDCTNQEYTSSEGYLGVVDFLLEMGAFRDLSEVQKNLISDRWYGMGWCVANQGEFVKFTCDRATIDKQRGEFVGVIEASIEPMDDYYVYNC